MTLDVGTKLGLRRDAWW